MDARRPSLVAIVAIGLVLGQVAGCGSCVKDDPPQQSVEPGGRARKPIDLRAADKNLSQFSDAAKAAAAPNDGAAE